jgi:hypothetical protein
MGRGSPQRGQIEPTKQHNPSPSAPQFSPRHKHGILKPWGRGHQEDRFATIHE